MIAKVQIALGLTAEFAGRYYLLYAAFLPTSVLLWSVAFLHRQRALELVGALGVIATAFPIGAIVVGHLVVGVARDWRGRAIGGDRRIRPLGPRFRDAGRAHIRLVGLCRRMAAVARLRRRFPRAERDFGAESLDREPKRL